MNVPRELMTITEVAELLRLPVATLRYWRNLGDKGPKSAKIGSHVLYRRADVEAWLDAQFK
jgi:excisionase family DNA binding protein